MAAGLVGAIVAELPTGAQAGLGARLLTSSYYGNTVAIWSALVMASVLGLVLTGAITLPGKGRAAPHAAAPSEPANRAWPATCRPWRPRPGARWPPPLALARRCWAPARACLRPWRMARCCWRRWPRWRPVGPARRRPVPGPDRRRRSPHFLALPRRGGGDGGCACWAPWPWPWPCCGAAGRAARQPLERPAPPLFGLWLLYLWELGVTVFEVPRVLLPAPSLIVQALWDNTATLGGDFVQTVLKSVLIGYLLGNGLGVLTGIAIDRAPFLQRGLQLAALTSTVPLVGVAPIAVMWFGFDWPSKAAVIVLMTFFPALINTLAGLEAAGKLERELMHSYAAGYRPHPAVAAPAHRRAIFGALKVNATLSLIGAIVAEFFGSPTAGLGFRISTEAARMNMPLVWAAIVVAALTGSGLYALLSRLERRVNFWHPGLPVRADFSPVTPNLSHEERPMIRSFADPAFAAALCPRRRLRPRRPRRSRCS
jgi:NitT/TauT family transport system permease protein